MESVKWGLLLVMLLILIPQGTVSAYANADVGNGTRIEFSGRLFETSVCRINGGKELDVDFGRINVKQINGIEYSVIKVLPFACDPNGAPSVKVLIAAANPSEKWANVIKTSSNNLGIAFYDAFNATEIPIGKLIDIDLAMGFLLLRMVPVKESFNVSLKNGDFTASALIVTVYN